MAEKVRAKVKKELLIWARQSAGYSPEEAAKKVGTSPAILRTWESGTSSPTIAQLKTLGQVYKRPIAMFYLPEPPLRFQPMRDLRRLPGKGMRRFEPQLMLEMRAAQEQRELAIELARDAEETIPTFSIHASVDEDPESVGRRIRQALHVTDDDRIRWSKDQTGYAAFNALRERIEDLGVLVFQSSKLTSDDVSGFAIAEEPLPAILVTRRQTSIRRRTFGLIHELAHVALRVSGVSEVDVDATRPPEDSRVERWCNAVAAAVLLPRQAFMESDEIRAGSRNGRWSEESISALSRRFSVSREVVVRRMLTFNLTTSEFYDAKREQYRREFVEGQVQKRADIAASQAEFRKNPARDAVTDLGAPLVRRILDSYFSDRITLSDASDYLGVRAKHVARIDAALAKEGA